MKDNQCKPSNVLEQIRKSFTRYKKSPDPAAAFHYIARPHFICKHEFSGNLLCSPSPNLLGLKVYWYFLTVEISIEFTHPPSFVGMLSKYT